MTYACHLAAQDQANRIDFPLGELDIVVPQYAVDLSIAATEDGTPSEALSRRSNIDVHSQELEEPLDLYEKVFEEYPVTKPQFARDWGIAVERESRPSRKQKEKGKNSQKAAKGFKSCDR